MTGHAQFARDVAFFLIESTLQSACLCLLVFLVTRGLAIRNPGLRSNLWLMAVVYPVVTPLACHILLPRSGLRPEMKLLENTLAGSIAWLDAHQALLYLGVGAVLSLLFSLDVIRWLVCGLRAGAAGPDCEPGAEQATRCAAALREIGRRSGAARLPEIVWCAGKHAGVYTLRWPRPRIYLPVTLVRSLDAGELRAMLAHELAHLQRRDWLRLLAGQLGRDLTFFNPLAHLAYAQFLQATEEAADDAAVIATADRLSLAACLLKVQAQIQRQPVTATGFVHRPTNVVRRVARLLQDEAAGPYPAWQPRAGWAVSAAGLLLAAII